jgi:apolipoprotein N-acyltransferase
LSSRSAAYVLASASGALLALSFPKFGHPAVAWIALAPLLVALTLAGTTLSRAFLLGLLTGAVYFTGTLYWITGVMANYGDMASSVAVPINALLVGYQSAFVAVFALVLRRILVKHGPLALMAAPPVWVATELGRTHFLSGFPWVLLGYSQTSVLPIVQLASIFGVYGVSMLVASVSAALALYFLPAAKAGRRQSGRVTAVRASHWSSYESALPLIVVLAVIIGVAVWGSRRAARAEWTHSGEAIRIGLIQGNVDQDEKAQAGRAAGIFQDYLRMTRQAIGEGAQFVLWPESSTPFRFEDDPLAAAQIRTLARQARVSILFGSDQFVRGANGAPTTFYNSAFLVRPDGTTGGVYRKMHLVPFGEYVPAKSLFFFAAPLVQAVSDFSAGQEAALLPVGDHLVSTAICYEVVYPDLVRRFVACGSELLTTITNDAWFGPTSAPYQHFEQASMRAVEEGRYLVRSANTGISGIVDPYGRVIARTGIFQPAVLVGDARFLTTSTFYARHGDVLAYASVLTTALLLVVGRRRA